FLRMFGPAMFGALILMVVTLFNQASNNVADLRRETKLATERGADAIQASELEERSARLHKALEEADAADKRMREEWLREGGGRRVRDVKDQVAALGRGREAGVDLARALTLVRERLTVLENRSDGKGGKPNGAPRRADPRPPAWPGRAWSSRSATGRRR